MIIFAFACGVIKFNLSKENSYYFMERNITTNFEANMEQKINCPPDSDGLPRA